MQGLLSCLDSTISKPRDGKKSLSSMSLSRTIRITIHCPKVDSLKHEISPISKCNWLRQFHTKWKWRLACSTNPGNLNNLPYWSWSNSASTGQCTMQHCCSGDRWPPMRLDMISAWLLCYLFFLSQGDLLNNSDTLGRFQKFFATSSCNRRQFWIELCYFCFGAWFQRSNGISAKGITFVVPRKDAWTVMCVS